MKALSKRAELILTASAALGGGHQEHRSTKAQIQQQHQSEEVNRRSHLSVLESHSGMLFCVAYHAHGSSRAGVARLVGPPL